MIEKRRASIAQQILESGEVEYAALARSLDVSEMTIRRDIDVLESRGIARRVLGGAIAFASKADEPAFEARVVEAAHEKDHIAQVAVQLLSPGETVILDSGSTVLAIARQIKGRELGLTVITPSIFVALELADEPNTTVLMTGGEVRGSEMSLIGSDAEDAFARYNCDTYIMGVAGVDAKRGITDYHRGETNVKKAAMKAADRVILTVDSSKLGRVQLVNIAALSSIEALVTDGSTDHPTLIAAREFGIEVFLADEATRSEHHSSQDEFRIQDIQPSQTNVRDSDLSPAFPSAVDADLPMETP